MSFFSRFIFPVFCVGCGLPGTKFCFRCRTKVFPYFPQKCLYCGKSSFLGFTHGYCFKTFGVDGSFSFFHYQNPLVKLLKIAKYKHSEPLLWELLQELPVKQVFNLLDLKKFLLPLVVVCVPQHMRDKKIRGFNQSYIIGKHISQILNIPTSDFLVKTRRVEKQARLPYQLREKNIKGAFKIFSKNFKRIVGKSNLLIVDDVITTGATIKELAWVLKRRGVPRVFAVSLFRAY